MKKIKFDSKDIPTGLCELLEFPVRTPELVDPVGSEESGEANIR